MSFWFKVPTSIWDDHNGDLERIAAEVLLRMLGQRNDGEITETHTKMADRLGWGRPKLYRFINGLIKNGKFDRTQPEHIPNRYRTPSSLIVKDLNGVTVHQPNTSRTDGMNPHYGERKKEKEGSLNKEEEKRRGAAEAEAKRRIFG